MPVPMAAEPAGWFRAEAPAGPESGYGFRLDGGDLLPDPRSPHQPDGVDGLSRTVDHSAFAWSDAGWEGRGLESAVIYEVHTGTFSAAGTFDGLIPRLGHLVDLGVTHLELMPVGEFVGSRGWGYDVVGLYAPHHSYGGPDGLKRLVDACHSAGLAVILDVIYNHVGDEGCYLPRFGPYLRDRTEVNWGRSFDLDGPGSRPVRDFLVENALMWLHDYHIDGLRLDAVDHIRDASPRHLLAEMAGRIAELAARAGRRMLLIAESDLNDPVLMLPAAEGGYGLDAQWLDDFHHALHTLLTGERRGYYADFGRVADLATALRDAYVYSGRHSAFHGRLRGRPAGALPGDRFVAFAQNHDQVGNRPWGDRMSMLVGTERLRMAAAVVLLSPYVPLLFMGEEWGARTPFRFFAEHKRDDVINATSEGRLREMRRVGWDVDSVPDPQDPATFAASRLDWSEAVRQPHADLLEWHRRLIGLRRSTPALTDGRRDLVQVTADEQAGRLEMVRGAVRLVCDFRAGTAELR